MIDTNKNITTSEPFYSSHIFLFPFKWACKDKEDEILELQTDLRDVHKLLTSSPSKWKHSDSWHPPRTLVAYNETSFFYDFVQDALYDTGKKSTFLRHYKYDLSTTSQYVIGSKTKDYKLEIDEILLHIYNTGVGILSFHLFNREQSQSSPDDILRINQYGRRIRAPFYGTDPDKIGTPEFFSDMDWTKGLDKVKDTELPLKIHLENESGPFIIEEFFLTELPPKPDKLPNHIKGLLPSSFFSEVRITHVLDDRMFVVCWYGNKKLASELGNEVVKSDVSPQGIQYEYQKNDWWYKYIFVDGDGKTCQNKSMAFALSTKQTNGRWVDYGTLYGVSRYSMVVLTGVHSDNSFNSIVSSHVQSMYYKMAELALVQRACVLRFSDEVTEISTLDDEGRKIKKLHNRVSSLYKQYIKFVNKIYFREVTAQEQGIETYDLLQKSMRLAEQVKDLDGEIEELHDYLLIEEQKEQNKEMAKLTRVASIFLPATLVAGVLGMNTLPESTNIPDAFLSLNPYWPFWYSMIWVIAGLGLGFIIAYSRRAKKNLRL